MPTLTIQEQVNELRNRLSTVQGMLSDLATQSDINTLNNAITDRLDAIVADLTTYETSIRTLENDMIDLREDLRTHTH